MKKLLFILFLFPVICFGQITYFNSASTPADNGTNTATTTAVTPPASMTTGDLVVIYAFQRGTATISISATGGQSWNTLATGTSAVSTLAYGGFWCVYNGTWGANPSVLFSAGTNTNVIMHVFRPTSSSYTWGLETTLLSFSDYTTSGGCIVSNSGTYTTVNDNTVFLQMWSSDDDNTWGTLTAGWTTTGSAQYRNTSGNDVSSSYGHKIYSTVGQNPGNTNLTQATLGCDPGVKSSHVFYQYIPAAVTRKLIQTGVIH